MTGWSDLRRRSKPKPERRYGWSSELGTIRPDTSGGSSSPWTNVIKLVTAINDEHLYYARVFVPGRLFSP